MSGLVVDLFAGGGGASVGLERALGRVDVAINHDWRAILVHEANHPRTRHYHTDVWEVDPIEATGGQPVDVLWASPDCTYFSKAKGGKPFRDRRSANKRRALATVVVRWARQVRPRIIFVENVEEFAQWGPLTADGLPDPAKRGTSFRRWVRQLEREGYRVEWQNLVAADYGAPTTRKRLFIVARRDGQPIVWPTPTHGPGTWRTAAECIDWSLPCPSIFGRRRPLAEATLRRIARGIMRYVVNNPRPFIVPYHAGSLRVHRVDEPLRTQDTANRFALVAPSLINTRNGERCGQAPRVRDIGQPFPTVTAKGSQGALVAAFLARHYGGHENDGAPIDRPVFTVTTRDHHALVSAFLCKYYGNERDGASIAEPIDTVTTKDRFGLVTVHGENYRIVDIGMRMLTPRELFRAQGFPEDYEIEPLVDRTLSAAAAVPKPLSRTDQVFLCGNSVSPPVSEALARANA